MSAEDDIRDLERRRLAALVSKDIEALELLHADEFQLINPFGMPLTKRDYIDGVASRTIDYRHWEPDSEIAVTMNGDVAALRYRSQLQVHALGQLFPKQPTWHTDVYVNRDGRWQVVFSQATQVAAPPA